MNLHNQQESAKIYPPKCYDIITLYADGAPAVRGLQIELGYPDWCEFEKKPFYRELMEYLESLETRDS